ncbi:unnamed protein product [Cuscuta epithymum]|uniref:Uncharacterized protein n=2 Tax=Cuscuta epithymum TaxID=186058 RepID=A0AAV0DW92_9ASTE|nr:unnamed protein product [Cuscuta epithymum]
MRTRSQSRDFPWV